ncbi:S46 family peptidase [Bacteroides pyogenes]|uniref:S46 family peptidase n=1 Tax=Bacteroides pyogenes TaxID=310300 RepID=UPI001BA4CB02|nr:S46 family peptidase [Bacteroides pyogenes]MBR8725005.1 Dipeptidyl-peptidase 7 [Bacteroides pyogenes]MBR8738519.1 Dipeptidyl-peptidase 7 [Bacteroides pyogenes]MBR8754191.1 Dipeptidyl-peptidase 7 [Bacteroides pyogenes]MBR8795016.1 Dipeptidyl-peptidase 7 [Bacteroides pyogenes]MBR8808952.1 Dipeptidyl-peptidase 7 [Bacteroides pyogenes]
MNRLRLYVLALTALIACSAKADEGMWLLQLMQEQHSIDLMKKQGLKLEAGDLYNPNGVSLKDAVGIFGGGCTGEIISPEGLILTNHHCGYASIQQHSSVEHDYLSDGFWATSRDRELPTPGLKFVFIERIEDITDIVNAKIAAKEITESESFGGAFLKKLAEELYEKSDLKGKTGIVPQALPFYAGNKFYLFYKKVYTDIRMVAAPPSSVGKFGGETDNWMWPRHTGDFSIFRVYADANGEPAEYSASNTPLKTKKHLTISLKGIKEGNYAMVMGFPGSTSRYLTVSEVKERMEAENEPRIRVRGARLSVLKEAMNASDKTRIQYANKYAGSSNYWKNSIGMNKAIVGNDVLGTKAGQEVKFAEFAQAQNKAEYIDVVKKIDEMVAKTAPVKYQLTTLSEVFYRGIEFGNITLEKLRKALAEKNDSLIQARLKHLPEIFEAIHNKDYDHEVDRKVAKALIPLYAEMVPADRRPSIYKVIEQKYKGNYDTFIDEMYDNSIFANRANFDKFMKNPSVKAIDEDVSLQYAASKNELYDKLAGQLKEPKKELDLLHKAYIRGLGEMKLPAPSYPDANFTLRLTYGNVKSYSPKDGVHYKYYTTANGILEKENPENREFVVPAKLKELIEKKDFGRYALPNGEMPVCFLSTNDITGGNSGSPVLNENGELIGCAFDGNWESLSGDINFDNNLQRCINLDIRYILFILEKLGKCGHLINEMTIVE